MPTHTNTGKKYRETTLLHRNTMIFVDTDPEATLFLPLAFFFMGGVGERASKTFAVTKLTYFRSNK
jgi:hypothetical protein